MRFSHLVPAGWLLVAWLTVALWPVPAVGLQINLTYDTNSTNPTYDPNAIGLGNIVAYVTSVFEDIIEDTHTLELTYRWDVNLQENNNAIGLHTFGDEAGGREVAGGVRFETQLLYYIDPTPADDSEYDMGQKLFRDLPGNRFKGSVPDVFEGGFNGQVRSDAPDDPQNDAQNGLDLLTLVFQEVGHALGLSVGLSSLGTETGNDADFDLNPNFVGGSVMALTTRSGGDPAHLRGNDAVMASLSFSERTRPSAADILAMAAVSGWTNIDLRRQDFLVGSSWNTAGNWLGNQVPGGLDDAFVRHGGAVGLVQDAPVSNLLITEDSSVSTNDNRLTVYETLTIERGDLGISSSQLYVGGINENGELLADKINVNQGGELVLQGGSVAANRINIGPGASLRSYGSVDLTGVIPKLRNDGLIAAGHSSKMLRFTASDSLAFDLDGDSEDGLLEAVLGDLRFESSLTDPFDSRLTVAAGRTASFLDGWSVGKLGVVDLNGGPVDVARVQTGLWDLSGRVQASGKTQIDTDEQMVVKQFADVSLAPAATLKMTGPTRFEGGTMTLANDAILEITGATTIEGGNFNVGDDARLVLSGPTAFEGGGYFGTGTMVQNGDATFKTNTIINVETYDWDGAMGGNSTTTVWPGVVLTINALEIEADFFDGHDGKITLDGGILSVNTTESWRLDGVLELKQQDFFTPAIYGQRMVVRGSILGLDDATIFSEVSFAPSASVLVNVGKMLMLDGDITFSGGSYNGFGTIRQDGNAIVLGDTLIGMSTYDMDGQSESAHTTIVDGVTLAMNVGHIDTNGSDKFDGTLNVAGTLNVQNIPGKWTMDGLLVFDDGTVSGVEVLVTGIVQGNGTFDTDINNMGQLGPGDSPGEISVLGTYQQGATGVLNMEIGGLVPVVDFDRLWIFGNGMFDGTLNLIFIDGFAPQAGQTFELIHVGGSLLEGDFTTINVVNLMTGFEFTAGFDEDSIFRLRARNDGIFVPEPPTLLLAAIGLLTLGFYRRYSGGLYRCIFANFGQTPPRPGQKARFGAERLIEKRGEISISMSKSQ